MTEARAAELLRSAIEGREPEAARCGLYGLADALGKVGRSNDRPTFDDDA